MFFSLLAPFKIQTSFGSLLAFDFLSLLLLFFLPIRGELLTKVIAITLSLVIICIISYLNHGFLDVGFYSRYILVIVNAFCLYSLFLWLPHDRVIEKNKLIDHVSWAGLLIVFISIVYFNVGIDRAYMYFESEKSLVAIFPLFAILPYMTTRTENKKLFMLNFLVILLLGLYYEARGILLASAFIITFGYLFLSEKSIVNKLAVLFLMFVIVGISSHFIFDLLVTRSSGSNSARMIMMAIPFFHDDFFSHLVGMGYNDWLQNLSHFAGSEYNLRESFLSHANPHNLIIDLYIRGGGLLVTFTCYLFWFNMKNCKKNYVMASMAFFIATNFTTTTGIERWGMTISVLILLIGKSKITKSHYSIRDQA